MALSHEFYMKMALREAQLAYDEEEVPVGAVITMDGQVIGKGHNQVERLTDVTAHAEIIALTAAFNALGSKYLPGAVMYVTLEPCLMCAGAIELAQISQLVFAASDAKRGYARIYPELASRMQVVAGLMESESSLMLKDFFKARR